MPQLQKNLREGAKAEALTERLAPHFRTLQITPEHLARVLRDLRYEVTLAGQRRDWTGDDREALIVFARDQAIEEIDRLECDARAARAAIERELAATLDEPSEPLQAILNELQEQRVWARIERLLESVEPAVVVELVERIAQQAAATGDLLTFRVLRMELPIFLQSLDSGIDPREALTIVEAAERPLLLPEQRQARAMRAELIAGWQRIVLAFNQARAEASAHVPLAAALPGWRKDTTVLI